jgi:hypothetical protein
LSSSATPLTPWITCGNMVDNPWTTTPLSGDSLWTKFAHPQTRRFYPPVIHTVGG